MTCLDTCGTIFMLTTSSIGCVSGSASIPQQAASNLCRSVISCLEHRGGSMPCSPRNTSRIHGCKRWCISERHYSRVVKTYFHRISQENESFSILRRFASMTAHQDHRSKVDSIGSTRPNDPAFSTSVIDWISLRRPYQLSFTADLQLTDAWVASAVLHRFAAHGRHHH